MPVDCPYVGLVPFTEESAAFFFGRKDEQDVLIGNLFAARVTVLYGPSGVGKSSLLRAGVVQELGRRNQAALDEDERPELMVVYFKDWQDRPLLQLQERIRAAAGLSGNGHAGGLLGTLEKAVACANRDVMLLLDQVEDYFKYADGGPSFEEELAAVLQRNDLPVSVLLSLRDDALSRLDRFQPLIPTVLSNTLRVDALTEEQAAEAIRRPLDAYNGLPSSQRHPGTFTVEDELVKAVIAQVRRGQVVLGDVGRGRAKGAATTSVEAPYLQLVMTKIWAAEVQRGSTVLRAATLAQLGGAQRIVQSHLDGVMKQLTGRQRKLAARVFEQLVTPGGNKIAHTAQDLGGFAKASPEKVKALLEALSGSQARIVTPVAALGGQDASRYEIFHDALAPAVLDWRRRHHLRSRIRDAALVVLVLGGMMVAWGLRLTQYATTAAREVAARTAAEKLARDNERRALLAEEAARTEAARALAVQAQLARDAQRLADAQGKAVEAERYRKVALAAAQNERNLQQKIAETGDSSAREIDQLKGQVVEAQRQLQAAREQLHRAQGLPTSVRLTLASIRVAQDGSAEDTRWAFQVRASGRELKHRALEQKWYNNDDTKAAAIGASATVPLSAAGTVDLEVTGKADNGPVASGRQSVAAPRVADWTEPLAVKLPVFVESDPRRGTFIFEFQLRPAAATPAQAK